MIQINFKDCCRSCVERETYVREHKFYGDNIVQTIETIIGCEHEKVCYKYEQEKAKEFMSDIFKNVDFANQDDITVETYNLEKMSPEELAKLGFCKLKAICKKKGDKKDED